MGSVMPQRLLTYADLEALPEDNLRREIIDGELIVSPSPERRHQDIVLRLAAAIHNHVSAHGGGEVVVVLFDVELFEHDIVQPDLLVVSAARAEIAVERPVRGAPDLVIEVLSDDARYDRVRKRDLYARAGVPLYWIVDPESDRVEVLALEGERYARPVILEAGDTLGVPFLPELRIDVGQILAR
jgi:Uma2 family endonuclease